MFQQNCEQFFIELLDTLDFHKTVIKKELPRIEKILETSRKCLLLEDYADMISLNCYITILHTIVNRLKNIIPFKILPKDLAFQYQNIFKEYGELEEKRREIGRFLAYVNRLNRNFALLLSLRC